MITSIAVTSLLVSLLAFVGVVSVRRLQLEMAAVLNRGDQAKRTERMDSLSNGVRTVVLVVQAGCSSCESAATAFSANNSSVDVKLAVLSSDDSANAYAKGSIEAVVSPEAVGRLFVDAVPLAVELDTDGTEVRRQIITSPDAVHIFVRQAQESLRSSIP